MTEIIERRQPEPQPQKEQPQNPLDYFARIVGTFRREEAMFLNQVAARSLNNLLYLLAKSGSERGELDAQHMEMFWERLEQDIQTIRRFQTGHKNYAPKTDRTGLRAVADALRLNPDGSIAD